MFGLKTEGPASKQMESSLSFKICPLLQGQCYPLLGAFLYDNKKFVGLNVWVTFAHGVSTPYESMKPIMNYTFINQ
jgi:hypothetical protein